MGPVLFWGVSSLAAAEEGFYKDLFMDGGDGLTSREELYAAELLGLTYDVLATSSADEQYEAMIASEEDTNGQLLYPDGAPRYRLLYTNGGSATSHGSSMGEEGRERVRDFFDAGGSYTGSCAGAFIAMLHYDIDDYEENGAWSYYYHLWPGIGTTTYTASTYHDIVFEDVSHPLVQKYASLSDGLVEDVYHNYGCRFDPDDFNNPLDTEYIGINDSSTAALDGYYNIIAWKESAASGRVVVTCSHPEGSDSGEKRDLMAAILQYALDGQGDEQPAKGSLENGVTVEQVEAHERVGDKQYHYWSLTLPEHVASVEIALEGLTADSDLLIAQGMRPDRLSHDDASTNADLEDERILLLDPAPGSWSVAVYGAHEVRNGASYALTAHWSIDPDAAQDTGLSPTNEPPGAQRALSELGCAVLPGPAGVTVVLIGLGAALHRRRR